MLTRRRFHRRKALLIGNCQIERAPSPIIMRVEWLMAAPAGGRRHLKGRGRRRVSETG